MDPLGETCGEPPPALSPRSRYSVSVYLKPNRLGLQPLPPASRSLPGPLLGTGARCQPVLDRNDENAELARGQGREPPVILDGATDNQPAPVDPEQRCRVPARRATVRERRCVEGEQG